MTAPTTVAATTAIVRPIAHAVIVCPTSLQNPASPASRPSWASTSVA